MYTIRVLMKIFACFSDYQRHYQGNTTDIDNLEGTAPIGSGIETALWQLSLALVFKMLITVFTFGIKVSLFRM